MVGRLRARLGDQGLTPAAIQTDIERFYAMGTRIELHRFGAGDDDALPGARRAIEAVDDALTIHRPSSTTALNEQLRCGGRAAVDDPLLFDALVEIDAAHGLSHGLFDPCAGSAGWGAIAFDRANARIEADGPVALDFGGFGKGFALDRACAVLRGAGIASALLTAGESSIAVIGEHPLGGNWPFAIPHPLDPDRNLIELELSDAALSISSTVGAGAHAAGRAAMIRPGDGAIVTAPRSTIAVERSASLAEVMSTALLVADGDRAERLRADPQARRFLFDFTGEATMPPQPARMFL